MTVKNIKIKAYKGKYGIVCQADIFLKESTHFFYGNTDAEVISIDVPGWFKDALGELNWEYVKQKIKEEANTISKGGNGMELVIKY